MKLPATLSTVSLTTLMKELAGRGKRLPTLASNAIMYQLTRAVAHANCLGVCHRDVCPANVTIQASSCMTQLGGWDRPAASSSLYSAPELILSEESVIVEHMKADVWSLGMVLIEALTGSPLVKMDPRKPLQPHLVMAALFKSIGTPSEMALRILDPTSGSNSLLKHIIQHQPWQKLLRGSRADRECTRHCTELLDRMLDWNPATREPAVSLLSFAYFATSRAKSCKHKVVTQYELTTAEIESLISVVFAAHASRLAAECEVATWMSSSQQPPESESHATCGILRSRRRSRRGSRDMIRLATIHEDPLGEVAWRRARTPPASPSHSTPSHSSDFLRGHF
jgi:serine/threonine protein kinase